MVQEKKGIAYTAGIDKDGWQISATERADSSMEAVALLEATIAQMKEDGYVPFVKDYNKALENMNSKPVDVAPSPSAPTTDPFATTVVQEAEELGGVATQTPDWYEPPTQEVKESIASGVGDRLMDGYKYIGRQLKKPLVAECKQGDWYDIVVDSYKCDEDSVSFYNKHSNYPAFKHTMKGKGTATFKEIFPEWDPKPGDSGTINPTLLYVAGENVTDQGNAYQNLKRAEPA